MRTQELTAIFRREKFRSEDGFVIALGDVVVNGGGAVCICEKNDINLDEFKVGDLRGCPVHDPASRKPTSISLKGHAEPEELVAGLTYRFYGTRPADDPKWGPQFQFSTFIRATPHGRAGVVRYLAKCSGIGEKTAGKLWEKFQSDAVRILREQPDVAVAAVAAAGLSHFTEEKAAAASEFLKSEQRLEACTIDLIDLLGGRGFPKTTVKKAIQRWGNRAVDVIKRSGGYCLMDFRGCGFLRCDAMYLELGGNPASLKRQALCAWHALAKDPEGCTWQTAEAVVAGLKQKIAGAELRPDVAMLLAKRGRIIAERRDEFGRLWLAENKRAVVEDRCAWFAALAICESPGEWPTLTEADGLSAHQSAEWSKATTGRIGIFTGGGGSGKTYTIARAVAKVIAEHGRDSIALCAPTWAAANRMMDAMAEHGVEHDARSIHSTLGVAKRDEGNGDGWAFVHNGHFPLPHRFIICDEFSMVDTPLAASLLAARARGAHILLIGDVHQLPPVGHGAPLRDLISAGVPTGELTEIRRNSGTIVKAVAAMRRGERSFATDETICLRPADDSPPRNFKIIETPGAGPERQIAEMLRVYAVAKASGKNPVWDVQTIVAVNAKSKLGRKNINKILQRELNKSGQKVGGNPFFPGDKIVKVERSAFFTLAVDWIAANLGYQACTMEDDSHINDKGEVFVSNRELAEVVEVADKFTIARLLRRGEPIFIKIPRGNQRRPAAGDDAESLVDDEQDHRRATEGGDGNEKKTDTGCEWDLAYAMTCHIAQGSQFPWVVVLIDEYPGAKMIAQKEWLYTSFSRPQELCIGIGSKQTVINGLRKSALARRKTFLKEIIREKLGELRTGQVIERVMDDVFLGEFDSSSSLYDQATIEELCEAIL